ncbi:hypothetical protein GLOIN_2v1491156 [Rhizophagus irregularis DAOM 181602=DAOM 197198]|nr:hypothetical protein GLOIN_2v1491156 [Rhizophagus irregularis DAOM 181602=DAOM 197198]
MITKLLGRTGRTGFRDVGLGRTDRDAGLGLFDEAGLNIDERVCVTYTVLIKKRTNFSINLESKISFIVQYLSFLILLESNQLDQMIVPKSSLTID